MSEQVLELLDSLGIAVEKLLNSHLGNLYEIRRAERKHGLDTCSEEINELNDLYLRINNQRRSLFERRKGNGNGNSSY